MARWPISDDEARAMYAGGRGDERARWYARVWGRVFASGITPRRWVRLEIPGRRSGRLTTLPVGLADVDGRWYLVSMLGECNWVRNARAAGGEVVLRHGRATRCRLRELPTAERGPVLRRYVEVAPGGRPHIPVAVGAPGEAFDAVADRYPVFEALDATGRPLRPSRSWFPLVLAAVVATAGCARLRATS